MPTLEDYARMIKEEERKCRWCGAKLNTDKIEMYPRSDGWTVDGLASKQWLYVTCEECRYNWALWELGVPRA